MNSENITKIKTIIGNIDEAQRDIKLQQSHIKDWKIQNPISVFINISTMISYITATFYREGKIKNTEELSEVIKDEIKHIPDFQGKDAFIKEMMKISIRINVSLSEIREVITTLSSKELDEAYIFVRKFPTVVRMLEKHGFKKSSSTSSTKVP